MHIQNNITPATSENHIRHLVTKKLYSLKLTADIILWCNKNPVPN